MQNDNALEVKNLTCRFDGRAVVDNISFEVGRGEVVSLLGPSGCGKSTTLRMIAGIQTPSEGDIILNKRTATTSNFNLPPESRGVGLMFQDFALFPHLTVAKNVGFGVPAVGRTVRVEDMLAKVGLSDKATRYPHELSGGEQQRVALARALAPEPAIMLMDEPFSSLDDRLRDDVRDATLDVLRENGASVLMVTHEPAEAMKLSDRIAIMRAGKIVQIGSPYTVFP